MAKNTIKDRKKRWIQFAILLHLLQRGQPITNYEQIVKNNSHHHWSDSSGWAMAKVIECILLKITKEVM